MDRVPLAAAAACAALLLAACSSSPTGGSTAGATAASSPTRSQSPTATAATPSPTATTASLAQCPTQPAPAASLPVLHRGGSPDDLAAASDGGLWVSDTVAGTVDHLTASGSVDRTLGGFSVPEGIVPLSTGDMLVAEQGRDRIDIVHPDGSHATVITLPPHSSSVDGLDGIAIDGAGDRVLIPDSPHGTLLSTPLPAFSPLTRLAANLGRPVGVASGPDQALYVTAENAAPRGLFRVDAQGNATTLGDLAQLDDVIALDGLLYVTELATGTVRAVDPATGAQRILATGLHQPQGLAALPDGRIAVADSTGGVIRTLPAC